MSTVSHIQTALGRTHRRQRAVEVLGELCVAASAIVAGGFAAILADAVFAFPAVVRWGIDAMLIALAIFAAARVGRAWARSDFNPRRLARLIERRLGVTDSRLINAVEFASAGAGPDAPAEAAGLRRLAVEDGEAFAAEVQPQRVVERRRLKRRALLAAAALGVALLCGAAAPRLFGMVLPRYLDPGGDHPPFTLVRFDVRVEPQRVYYGRPVTIEVALSGPIEVDRAAVVFVGEDERQNDSRRLAMFRTEAGRFSLPIERAERSRRFYVETPHGRSRTHELAVLPVPTFERVTVGYAWPAYTGRPPVERTLEDRGIRALVGSTVTLSVRSNLPLREGRLALIEEADGGESSDEAARDEPPAGETVEVTLSPTDTGANEVSGSFVLNRSGRYRLTLIAADDTPSDTTLEGPVTAVSDAPPQVQLLSPDLRVEAPVNWRIPVAAAASDDIGVDRIVLHHRVNDEPAVGAELPLRRRGPGYATGSVDLDLSDLGVGPGDTVRGFAVAYDNHPNPPQSADSATFEVRVLSIEAYRERARQRYRIEQIVAELDGFAERMRRISEQRDRLIERLERLQEKMAGRGGEPPEAEEDREALQEISRLLAAYAEQSGQLADAMRRRAEQDPLYDFEAPVQETLRQTADRLRAQHDAAASNRQGLRSPSRQNLEETLERLRRDREQDRRSLRERRYTREELEKLRQADGMMLAAERIIAIADRQKQIAGHLSSYREAPHLTAADRARLARLAEQQRELREALTRSLERLEEAADGAGEALPTMSASARDLVAKVREMGVEADQRRAEDHARAERGDEAWALADSASRKLESLISECQGLGNHASDDLDGVLGLSRSQLASSLAQLAQGRQGLDSDSGSGGGFGASGRFGDGFGAPGPMPGGALANGPMLAGPHIPAPAGAELMALPASESGSYGRADRGEPSATGRPPDEVLTPDRAGRPRATVGTSSAVPVQYRQLAEEYFRRLARDTAGAP